MDTVPIVDSLDQIYTDGLLDQAQRYDQLAQGFEALYGQPPALIARAPGRVNLIGEHVDYCGFPVFPMAIERDCLIAVAWEPASAEARTTTTTTTTVRLSHVHSDQYPACVFTHPSPAELARHPGVPAVVDISANRLTWSNYFKCGYRGAHELMAQTAAELPASAAKPPYLSSHHHPSGLNCLMNGNIPTGAGLSSSSAFVSCAAIATMAAHELLPLTSGNANPSPPAYTITTPPSASVQRNLDRTRLTEIAISSERYVGVNSGGMDQTCSIMSQPNSASFIEFYPRLRATPVAVPRVQPALTFVIANSGVTSDKLVTAPVCYNLRVVETRLGALLLARYLGIDQRPALAQAPPNNRHFKLVMDEPSTTTTTTATATTTSPSQSLRETGWTRTQISQVLDTPWPQLERQIEVDRFPIHAEVFHVYRRAHHVFSEALRVVQFRQICQQAPLSATAVDHLFQKLGQLMNDSQTSCRDWFDCSCPELDELTYICRAAGAVGSRLTGAGWGGCTVSLVPSDRVDHFLRTVHREYYQVRNPALGDEPNQSDLFATQPGRGAVIYRV
ncbi:ribosomal protein S5 domain 2-type protein [Dimargaris cristalligena]|uniref:Ribosomal protein S5 domain 2-type protein n=1 Tax=Dimargaris cristalligena TaxID=215637 RepID=A0A4P9ZRH3_9FUNG|nr:ribosomal protein S5 domain 2-type protein [Dimargaris cristalligena]|eukprot:RKP35040.1 ribosomal protein S5 domain 2-type protein [Dimargaris cristalligena]